MVMKKSMPMRRKLLLLRFYWPPYTPVLDDAPTPVDCKGCRPFSNASRKIYIKGVEPQTLRGFSLSGGKIQAAKMYPNRRP
jgi:hypothetical protein